MSGRLRVVDSGVGEARLNIATGQALVERHQEGLCPDILRFLRFPPTAFLGRHQDLSRELKLDFCRENNIAIARRITGGGAIYLDEGQVGWELVMSRKALGNPDLGGLTKTICEAAASGLSELGIAAEFRPRSDIAVDGQKISGSGGFFDGDTLFYQGTVLVDMNPAAMFGAINMPLPQAGEGDHDRPRVTTLKALLGEAPGVEVVTAALTRGLSAGLGIEAYTDKLTGDELAQAKALHDEEIGADEFIAEIDGAGAGAEIHGGEKAGPGGTVRASLRLEGANSDRIREVVFSGDFFVTPPKLVLDLESALRGIELGEVGAKAVEFFAGANPGLMTVGPNDFADALLSAAKN